MSTHRSYPAKVLEAIDGDTLTIDVAVCWDTSRIVRVRVHGINAPEKHSHDPAEQAAGLAAMTYAGVIAPAGAAVAFVYLGPDKYAGRVQGTITLADGRDFAAAMVEASHARWWDGHGPRPT